MLALLLGVSTAQAQIQVDRAEIVRFGIYTADAVSNTPGDQNNQIALRTIDNLQLALATTTITAQLGVRFGIQYRVVGQPSGGDVTVHTILRFPAGGLHPPTSSQPVYVSERDPVVKLGEVTYRGYRFDNSWEQVPGTWTFEVWHQGRKLAEQKFTVVAP
jgi:hypothetical protein